MSSSEGATRRRLVICRNECGLATMQMRSSAAFGYGTLAILDVEVGLQLAAERTERRRDVGQLERERTRFARGELVGFQPENEVPASRCCFARRR